MMPKIYDYFIIAIKILIIVNVVNL